MELQLLQLLPVTLELQQENYNFLTHNLGTFIYNLAGAQLPELDFLRELIQFLYLLYDNSGTNQLSINALGMLILKIVYLSKAVNSIQIPAYYSGRELENSF